MDAINRLTAGARAAEARFDAAAQQVASADLPTATHPDPTNPAPPAPPRAGAGDVIGQIATMNIAVDMHHVTTAALRSAFSLYRDSIDLLRPQSRTDS